MVSPFSLRAIAAGLESVSALSGRVTAAVAIVTTTLMFACMILQIVFRYIFADPLSWSEEAAVFLFIWTMLLLASLGVRERFHVRLELMFILLPKNRLRSLIELMITVVIIVFGIALIVTGAQMVELVWNNTSAAIRYPSQFLYFSVPVAGGLMVLHAVAQIFAQWAERRP